MTTMPDGNSAALAAYQGNYNRRERFGERAEEILNDIIADMLGDAEEIYDILASDRKWSVMLADALRADPWANPLQYLRKELIKELADRYRHEARDQAEQEATDNGQFGVGA